MDINKVQSRLQDLSSLFKKYRTESQAFFIDVIKMFCAQYGIREIVFDAEDDLPYGFYYTRKYTRQCYLSSISMCDENVFHGKICEVESGSESTVVLCAISDMHSEVEFDFCDITECVMRHFERMKK